MKDVSKEPGFLNDGLQKLSPQYVNEIIHRRRIGTHVSSYLLGQPSVFDRVRTIIEQELGEHEAERFMMGGLAVYYAENETRTSDPDLTPSLPTQRQQSNAVVFREPNDQATFQPKQR